MAAPALAAGQCVLALSGGVGGAKLALGLARQLEPAQLAVVCNTGDDFEHLGLPICPDLDTVMYTLAGRDNKEQGWGLAGESWRVLETLGQLGADTWFRLGDMDIATHLRRGELLRRGHTLRDATRLLCRQLGVAHTLWPMSDDPVRTLVLTADGELSFQHYFVREQCRPAVRGFRFHGIDSARAQPDWLALLRSPALAAVVLCPSNPFVSIDPILHLPGVRAALLAAPAPVVAVCPLVGGAAIKGPTAKMMDELALPRSAAAVAAHYGDLLDGFIIDQADAGQAAAIAAQGVAVRVTQTVMKTLDDRIMLAGEVLRFAAQLSAGRPASGNR
jgi:LPPG:FO 2-phospho-L-lactate transferase